METKISAIGGGSWATVLIKILTTNIDQVYWYMRNEQPIGHTEATKHNPNYLNDVHLNISKLHLTSHLDEVVAFSDYIIFCIPSAFLNDELSKLTLPLADKTIFSAIKGIEPKGGLIVGEYSNKMHRAPYVQIDIIAGLCHAGEVALEWLSCLTIACLDEGKTRFMAETMNHHYMRTKVSDDAIGIEYAAMLKNVYALTADITHGSGYGDNLQSVLMSNATHEMRRYIKHIHKMKHNINNSAYLGNLSVTSYSFFSRNYMFGAMIGKGCIVKSTMAEMNMVAEGYYATKSAYLISKNQEKSNRTPILDAVYKVLYEGKRAKTEFIKLTAELDWFADLAIIINSTPTKLIKTHNVMPVMAISPATTTNRKALGTIKEAPKEKLSYYRRKKITDEIAQLTNRDVIRRNLVKTILEE